MDTRKIYLDDRDGVSDVIVYEPIRNGQEEAVAVDIGNECDITLLSEDSAQGVLRGLMYWQIDQLHPTHVVRVALEKALRAIEGR